MRNFQRLEVILRDGVELRLRTLPRLTLRPALNEIVTRRPGLPSHPKIGHARCSTHSGHRTQTVEHVCIEPAPGPDVRPVVRDRVLRVGYQHTIRREPEVDVLERLERSHQQPCGRQQDDRQRDFSHDQRRTESSAGARYRPLRAALLQRIRQVKSRRMQGRHEPEDQRRQQREPEREQEDRRVHPHFVDAGQGRG